MDYRYGSRTVQQIEYHFVWVSNYHCTVLTGEVVVRLPEHRFEPNANDNFKMERELSEVASFRRRVSGLSVLITQTHRLQPLVVEFRRADDVKRPIVA